MGNEDDLEGKVFSSRLAFARANCAQVNGSFLRNYSELTRSSNIAEKVIGYVGKIVWPVIATVSYPFAILISMEVPDYSEDKKGYVYFHGELKR